MYECLCMCLYVCDIFFYTYTILYTFRDEIPRMLVQFLIIYILFDLFLSSVVFLLLVFREI